MGIDAVNVVPNFSNARFLNPINNFQSLYQGQLPDNFPIACPGERDFLAGKDGYAPNLLAGVPTKLGTRVVMWVPRILNGYGQETASYVYRVIWRLRPGTDIDEEPGRAVSGSLGPTKIGAPQSDNGAKRFILPAATETVQFPADQRTYLTSNGSANDVVAPMGTPGLAAAVTSEPDDPINVNIASAQYKPLGTANPGDNESQDNYWVAPINKDFNGIDRLGATDIVSQGVYGDLRGTDNQNAGYFGGPSFVPWTTIAKGDEMIVLIFRDERQVSGSLNWDFTSYDQGLADVLTRVGLIVMSGM